MPFELKDEEDRAALIERIRHAPLHVIRKWFRRMPDEEMFDPKEFLQRLEKMDADRVNILLRVVDKFQGYMDRFGGRGAIRDLQTLMPFLMHDPMFDDGSNAPAKPHPHKAVMTRHIQGLREHIGKKWYEEIARKRLDLDDALDDADDLS